MKVNLPEAFSSMHEALKATRGSGHMPQPNRKRKPIRKFIGFLLANLIVMPAILLIYLIVGSHGLTEMVSVLGTPLFRTPIPGASYLEVLDGWNRVSVAMVLSLVLAIVLTVVWKKVFEALQDPGHIAKLKKENPILLYLVGAIYALTITVDGFVFYIGLKSTMAGSWNEQAEYIPLLATILFAGMLALMGAAHANHFRKESV
ncbi:MAG: hypothetical protein AAGA30_08620 [Planctomycetota bacterium]